ncbi:MAG: hypothetical protein K8U57_12065 [Planctomycetes bacterium]|nr:hypothetical protein [Planctomycetota bacterium]
MNALPTVLVPTRRRTRLAAVPFLAIATGLLAATAAQQKAAPAGTVPPAVLDPAAWRVAEGKGNTFAVGQRDGRPVVTAGGKALLIASADKLGVDTRVRVRFRLTDPAAKGTLTVAVGLANPADAREKGKAVSVAAAPGAVSWTVADPTSKARLPQTSGTYRPQFAVERSLAWPEALRANVEADMVASMPLSERRLTLDVVLRERGYEVSLDGIPLTSVDADTFDTAGHARVTLGAGVELHGVTTEAAPLDKGWLYRPVPLDGVLNESKIDGVTLARMNAVEHGGVPFRLAEPDAKGHDHVDVGRSWFRQGNLAGRYSGRGADAMAARWPGALVQDPARIVVRLPMARYRALHLLAAADGEPDSVPVVTAQFFRPQSGFPKNFSARVPAFIATSAATDAVPVKTTDGKDRRLYHVAIPIDGGQLAEFDDLDFVDVELTKQVQVYRASPDPLYYSYHAAGLPSSVHVYALTAERPAADVRLEASAYAHVWTAPEEPSYTVTVRNRRGPARDVQLELTTKSLDGKQSTAHRSVLKLPADGEARETIKVTPKAFGYHDVALRVVDGDQTRVERRSLAYLRADTRDRGDWDFGRGPLFGFWNWGGGHNTPSADKQLLVMAKGGIESTPGSFEEYTARHGDAARKVMEDYKLFTLKFAGAGDHYITGKFAGELKTLGLAKAKENFLKTLNERKSAAGPHSRPLFLSFYAEPSIGPVTHGIFPKFIGEPETPFTPYEKERYDLFLNGFVEGAKIVREHFPGVKCLLPHGDPAFSMHFLQRNQKEVAPLIDGVCVDIPCFERLPEQQFHQVALHRLYMTRKEMADAGIRKPLLPMYEGPCVPSGPGALTDQEQADITIRNSLVLLAYGVDVQNGGFPAFDTASYWGEQHYGFGVLNRVSLETPKVAYTAMATLTRHLNRCNYHKWVPTGSLNTFALQFKHYKSGKLVHVMWTLRGTRPATLAVPAGATVAVFDQNDNEVELGRTGNTFTFTLGQSPCYVEGLTADAEIVLGPADHSDVKPGEYAKKLGNPGDGTWAIATQKEAEYEGSHLPYIYRFPTKMTAKPVDAPPAQGGTALAVHFPQPEKERVFVPHYSVLTPAKPIPIPGKASHLGLWVKAAGDWGRAVYFLQDAKGESWISVGTRGAWNCDDLHSWTSFNFDGWRYLRMELPANSGHDLFRERGTTWWGPYSTGDGVVDLPLTLEKVVVERRTHVMYVNDPQPADRSDVLLGDLFAEYAAAGDATPEAVRMSAVRMPVPKDVKGLGNPIATLTAEGTGPAVKVERITLPTQEADGTQCHVHFPAVEGARQYDVWASAYPDGRGALHLGKAWKAPGQLVRGLRPNQNFYLFVTYTDAAGKVSKPSPGYEVNLQDFFGMK